MTELVGVMVGQYFLLEYLGREGIVETYRARPTTQGGYDVVLRLFRPQFPDPAEWCGVVTMNISSHYSNLVWVMNCCTAQRYRCRLKH